MKLGIGLLALSACLVWLSPTTASAQGRVSKCNELPYAQCVKCAIGRGFMPDRYEPYCRKR
jgi:hypothetical protein